VVNVVEGQHGGGPELGGRSGLKTPVETSPNTSAAPYFLDTTDNDGETSMD
jgi:hypothetical protein